jgi:hypothetical protein
MPLLTTTLSIRNPLCLLCGSKLEKGEIRFPIFPPYCVVVFICKIFTVTHPHTNSNSQKIELIWP